VAREGSRRVWRITGGRRRRDGRGEQAFVETDRREKEEGRERSGAP
jgi:hypothetical protein